MTFLRKNIKLLLFSVLLIFMSCRNNDDEPIPTPSLNSTINLSHFNHLFKEINFKEGQVGIVHIYSSYPNYEFATEPAEGFTCVDDVARAIMMLSKYITINKDDAEALKKLKMLTKFVLKMQNENGYFSNFIWPNLSVNNSGSTSVAQLNWWSLRALLGLEYAYPLIQSDADLANMVIIASDKLLANIKRDIPILNLRTETVNGIILPTWLPQNYAADQSALLILGLLKKYERTGDNELKIMIDAMAKGIMVMQKGDSNNYPYGVFLSWKNLWHAWGNNQAYALLIAGQKFNNQEYINSALLEIDNFYPYLLKNGLRESFKIQVTGENSFAEIDRKLYPHIAYGLRPMIFAAIQAYQYSKDAKHLKIANDLASWLSGNNDANTAIYNPVTGVTFDGIDGPSQVNKNAGAESTIEGLLILLEMEKLK